MRSRSRTPRRGPVSSQGDSEREPWRVANPEQADAVRRRAPEPAARDRDRRAHDEPARTFTLHDQLAVGLDTEAQVADRAHADATRGTKLRLLGIGDMLVDRARI